MDWGEILLSLLFNLIISVFFYLLVPVIFCLRKKSLTIKQIRKIVIINGIVVWLIFQILTLELTGEMGTGAAVFLWSAVANGLLKKHCLIEDEDEETGEETIVEKSKGSEEAPIEDKEVPTTKEDPKVSLSFKYETQKKHDNHAVPASDLRLMEEENAPSPIPPKTEVITEIKTSPERAIRYCSRCGGEIDADTAKCTKCGKQYLNKLTKIGIGLIAAAILLIIFGIVLIFAPITDSGTDKTSTGNANMNFSEYMIAERIAEIMNGKNSEYFDYIQEAYKIARTGNESYGKGKGAVANYINHLPIEYGEKIIMYRLIYQSDSTYCKEIVEYLNERDDISYDDTVYILTNLGFMVSSDGTASWN